MIPGALPKKSPSGTSTLASGEPFHDIRSTTSRSSFSRAPGDAIAEKSGVISRRRIIAGPVMAPKDFASPGASVASLTTGAAPAGAPATPPSAHAARTASTCASSSGERSRRKLSIFVPFGNVE